eukprot:gene13619-2496_t
MDEGGRKADLKLVLVGHAAVGKTAIVTRLVKGTDMFVADGSAAPTIGASFAMKEWRGLFAAIWDTAGAERYAPLSSFYLRRANAAFVVYDVTDEDSFKRAEELWSLVEEARNKMDLVEGDPAKVVVQPERARGLAQQRGGMFFEVSALRSTGIFESFDAVCSKVFPDQKGGSSRPKTTQQQSRPSGVVLGMRSTSDAGDTPKANNCCG